MEKEKMFQSPPTSDCISHPNDLIEMRVEYPRGHWILLIRVEKGGYPPPDNPCFVEKQWKPFFGEKEYGVHFFRKKNRENN
jgi:hypothetical protein